MKLDTILGTLLLGSLIACGSKEEVPADAQQPAAATTPATSSDATKPAGDTTSTDSTTNTAPAANDPNAPATTDPAAPAAPVPETCETLAAKAATPAGKLTDATVNGVFKINPVDVYATEDADGLHLVVTETANTCAYHANNLQAQRSNELTIDLPKIDAPGSFKPTRFSQESGLACLTDDQFGNTGTSTGGGSTRGTVTITAKSATLVEGTVSVTNFNGRKSTFGFSAPICAPLAVDAQPTCCAAPDQ